MKRYIKPEIEIIDIETETMLAGTGSGFEQKEPSVDDPFNIYSKGHNFSLWDEEDEEE